MPNANENVLLSQSAGEAVDYAMNQNANTLADSIVKLPRILRHELLQYKDK